MRDWSKYTVYEILSGTDNNGNRLISLFAQDYKALFGQEICPSCNQLHQKLQKYNEKMKTLKDKKPTGFVLKKMYENIPLEFGSPIYVNNQNMTDEYGQKLLKTHPRGKDLFDAIPEEIEDKKQKSPKKETKSVEEKK